MIQKERIKVLKKGDCSKGDYVLYWMQASQRCTCNHALEFAVREANQKRLPLIVYLGITPDYPEANTRHYMFMLEGLSEVHAELEKSGIKMIIRIESPEKGVVSLAKNAALAVFDKGYTKIQKCWRESASAKIDCPVLQIESDVIVPAEYVSQKEEYAASTFRPKITKMLADFLKPLKRTLPLKSTEIIDSEKFSIESMFKKLKVNKVSPSSEFRGGTANAEKYLHLFLREKIEHFEESRNDPSLDFNSHLSPYLHFGQISPLYVALTVIQTKSHSSEAFLEELIVRRELAINFVNNNINYDNFSCLDNWQARTLKEHAMDSREYSYSLDELENAFTHDPYWNAAQKEMLITGKMHGYMRMYWGKKIIEWSSSPEDAFKRTLYLNNKYEIDGRGPNAFAGVAWCFGKHDRPWQERPIFGKVRYMNAKGLERKFNMDAYLKKVNALSKGT